MKLRQCKCGLMFIVSGRNHKWCSRECFLKHRTQNEPYKRARREYMNWWRRKRRAEGLPTYS